MQISEGGVPAEFGKRHREKDLLFYGSSNLLEARKRGRCLGSIRYARRIRERDWGIITDLKFTREAKELPGELIHEAESCLRQKGVKQILGLVKDGQGLVQYFYRQGYVPKRRTVTLVWDLATFRALETNPRFRMVQSAKPDLAVLTPFISSSYQPYWVFWKDAKEPEKLIASRLRRFGWHSKQRLFLAYDGGKLIGVCDARVQRRQEFEQDTFEWGILLSKDNPGDKIGSTLLSSALLWLKEQGLSYARLTTTSGLDDYDPIIYLATLSAQATIESEYVILAKALKRFSH